MCLCFKADLGKCVRDTDSTRPRILRQRSIEVATAKSEAQVLIGKADAGRKHSVRLQILTARAGCQCAARVLGERIARSPLHKIPAVALVPARPA